MANKITEHRIIDTTKRSFIKYTGILDTDMANTVLVDVSSLAFSLNANGYIMQSNTHPKSSYSVTVKRVFGDVNVDGLLLLKWHGDSNTEFIVVGPGTMDIDLDKDGINAMIPNNEANTNGDILISTVGVTGSSSNNSFTIFLDIRKNNIDYDAGQTADPAAFNRGNRAP